MIIINMIIYRAHHHHHHHEHTLENFYLLMVWSKQFHHPINHSMVWGNLLGFKTSKDFLKSSSFSSSTLFLQKRNHSGESENEEYQCESSDWKCESLFLLKIIFKIEIAQNTGNNRPNMVEFYIKSASKSLISL